MPRQHFYLLAAVVSAASVSAVSVYFNNVKTELLILATGKDWEENATSVNYANLDPPNATAYNLYDPAKSPILGGKTDDVRPFLRISTNGLDMIDDNGIPAAAFDLAAANDEIMLEIVNTKMDTGGAHTHVYGRLDGVDILAVQGAQFVAATLPAGRHAVYSPQMAPADGVTIGATEKDVVFYMTGTTDTNDVIASCGSLGTISIGDGGDAAQDFGTKSKGHVGVQCNCSLVQDSIVFSSGTFGDGTEMLAFELEPGCPFLGADFDMVVEFLSESTLLPAVNEVGVFTTFDTGAAGNLKLECSATRDGTWTSMNATTAVATRNGVQFDIGGGTSCNGKTSFKLVTGATNKFVMNADVDLSSFSLAIGFLNGVTRTGAVATISDAVFAGTPESGVASRATLKSHGQCHDPLCSSCSHDGSVCTACRESYNVVSGVCVSSNNCLVADPVTLRCAVCAEKHGLKSDGTCQACTDTSTCQACLGETPATCTLCNSGYVSKADGTCDELANIRAASESSGASGSIPSVLLVGFMSAVSA